MLRTPQYTIEQRVFMVNKRAAGDSNKAVAFDFRRTFPLSGREPNRKTIMRNRKKFNKEGSVMNLNKGRSGRKASVLTEENLEKMKAMIEAEVDLPARMARSSCRKHNLDVPMSKSSFNRGIKKLGFHPYKLICKHKLKEADIPKRLAMCNYILSKNDDDPQWLSNLWTSDEANFNLNGLVNTKNVLCYSAKNGGRPENFSIETVKHPDGVMVFGCLRLDGLKMPLKFYYPTWRNGERVSGTLDGDGYYSLLRYHCLPFIRAQNNGDLDNQHWQQDGASCHRTRRVLAYLHNSFGDRMLALGGKAWGGTDWAPNSPDLAPLDFCVWGVMKSFVFAHPMPGTREELVEKIKFVWETHVTEDLIKRAAVGLLNRARKVIDANGGHQVSE